ncbi:hypothetical protein TI04_11685 [Achromatium sp. WMS2]|nr:hypothetical protein TI04_11685 [Achromatium sp. WMS2]
MRIQVKANPLDYIIVIGYEYAGTDIDDVGCSAGGEYFIVRGPLAICSWPPKTKEYLLRT